MLVEKVTLCCALELAVWEAGMCLGSQKMEQKKGLCHPTKVNRWDSKLLDFVKSKKY